VSVAAHGSSFNHLLVKYKTVLSMRRYLQFKEKVFRFARRTTSTKKILRWRDLFEDPIQFCTVHNFGLGLSGQLGLGSICATRDEPHQTI